MFARWVSARVSVLLRSVSRLRSLRRLYNDSLLGVKACIREVMYMQDFPCAEGIVGYEYSSFFRFEGVMEYEKLSHI